VRSAQAWEAAGDRERAASAWVEFSQRHPGRRRRPASHGCAPPTCATPRERAPRADELRAEYLKRWPQDEGNSLEILERLSRSRNGGATRRAGRWGTLLAAPRPGGKAAVPYFAQYMKRVAKSPAAASKPLLAEFRFRAAEETFETYRSAPLTQPLPPSIAAKQRLLDSLLVRYRRAVDLGVAEWAHAATYRIGEALVGFGEALEKSERPADLTGDDLRAYENVLLEQAMTFHTQGESVWSELLASTRAVPPMPGRVVPGRHCGRGSATGSCSSPRATSPWPVRPTRQALPSATRRPRDEARTPATRPGLTGAARRGSRPAARARAASIRTRNRRPGRPRPERAPAETGSTPKHARARRDATPQLLPPG
jgi:hypothetical protein